MTRKNAISEDPPIGIVLAAGLGTRLRPLTEKWAKPVLPFLNRPILHYSLDALCDAGIERIGVNACHFHEQVADCIEAWRVSHPGVEVTLSVEETLLGTGGGARGVWTRMGCPRGPAVIMNGDIVGAFDIPRLLTNHDATGRTATLLVSTEGEGRIFVDPSTMQVLRVPSREKAQGGCVELPRAAQEVSFCGVSVLSWEALEAIPARRGCVLRDGLAKRVADGSIGAEVLRGWYDDLGTPTRLWEATKRRLLASQGGDELGKLPPDVVAHAPVCIAPGVSFEGASEIGPMVVLGGSAVVRRGARLERAIVFGGEVSGHVVGRFRFAGTSLRLGPVHSPQT